MRIEIVVQIVSCLVALFGLGMIWFQLKLSTRLSQHSALANAHQEIISPAFRKALRDIFNTPDQLVKEFDEKSDETTREAFELVLGHYDLIGARLQDKVLPKDGTLKTEWKILLVLWPKVKPIVEARRKGRCTPYKEHFEWLYDQALLYQKKYYPEIKPELNPTELKNEKVLHL